MAAVVSIVSRRGHSIDTCHRNQSDKSRPVLYKLLILLLNSFISVTRWSTSVIKMGVVYVGVIGESRH